MVSQPVSEDADILSEPITDIINCSYKEQSLPTSWKEADVAPILKQRPVRNTEKQLRSISLTPINSKIAEEFIVEEHVKPAILNTIQLTNQHGCQSIWLSSWCESHRYQQSFGGFCVVVKPLAFNL